MVCAPNYGTLALRLGESFSEAATVLGKGRDKARFLLMIQEPLLPVRELGVVEHQKEDTQWLTDSTLAAARSLCFRFALVV